jgi:hypothetical protein
MIRSFTPILVVIIIVAIVFVLIQYTDIGQNVYGTIIDSIPFLPKKKSTLVLANPAFMDIYNSTCKAILDEFLHISGSYIHLTPVENKKIHDQVMGKCKELWEKENGIKSILVEKLPGLLSAELHKAVTDVYGKEIPEILNDWIYKDAILRVSNYLTFQDTHAYALKYGRDAKLLPGIDEAPVDLEQVRKRKIPFVPQNANLVQDEINKDRKRLYVDKVPQPLNTNKMLFNMNRYGYAAIYKPRPTTDIRGLSEATINMLKNMRNTKNPRGIQRAGHTSIMDLLVTGKGLQNEDMIDEAVAEYARKTGDREYAIFDHISGRIRDPGTSENRQISDTLKAGIIHDIRYGEEPGRGSLLYA